MARVARHRLELGSMRHVRRACTYGQRGWNEQPPGRLISDGGRPGDRHELLVARRVQPRDRAQQAPRVGVLRAGEDRVRRRLLDDPAGVHDRDLVGHLGDDAEVVRDDHDGRAELALQALDQLEDLRLDGHVERGRRLVGDQQLRVVGQRHRDHRALAHAAGELVRVGRRRACAAPGSRPGRASRPRGRSACALETSRCARTASAICVADLVEGVQRGQRVLEDHRDVVAADLAQLVVGRARAGRWPSKRIAPEMRALRDAREAHHGQGRDALARAGLADDAERLAAVDGVGDAVDGLDEAVVGLEVDLAGPRPRGAAMSAQYRTRGSRNA